MLRSEGRPRNLNLPFRALDPDRRICGIIPIRIGGDAEIRKGDAVGCLLASGGGGEGEEHGGFFVGACGVFFYGGEDGGGFSLGRGDGVINRLKTPC